MKARNEILRSFSMILQIGFSMIVPIALGVFIGIQIDRWLETKFLMIVFLIIGILSAFRNVYILTRAFYSKDLKREQEELKAEQEQKQLEEDELSKRKAEREAMLRAWKSNRNGGK